MVKRLIKLKTPDCVYVAVFDDFSEIKFLNYNSYLILYESVYKSWITSYGTFTILSL